jgi:predicted ester cyclase
MAIDPAHEALLNRVLESFESGDGHKTAALYEPDAVYHLYPESIEGREAIAESMASWYEAFPNITWELVNLMSSGDTFIAEGIFRGTHNGPMQTDQGEIPPTGKSVEVPCCFIGRVSENGMIAEDRTYFNAAIMMEQLGLA